MRNKLYKYGMRLRGFSPMCQPMAGLVSAEDGDRKYYNYLYYERKLTDKEVEDYEGTENTTITSTTRGN